jgi:DNA-binding Lrp family transcriptional regulator
MKEHITIRSKILKYLQDGKNHHFLEISLKIKESPESTYTILRDLKDEKLVTQPKITIEKSMPGFFKLKE